MYYKELDKDRANGCIRDLEHAYSKDGGLAYERHIAQDGCVVKTAGVDEVSGNLPDLPKYLIRKKQPVKASSEAESSVAM